MAVVRFKSGTQLSVIAPGGVHLLAAFDRVAGTLDSDLVITSACDGAHSGPDDPHHRGEAYDLRSKSFDAKDTILVAIMKELEPNPQVAFGGYITDHFFGWLEAAGTDNEHFHFQVRKGRTYP